MTDTELIAAIRKVLRSRPRLKGVNAKSVEAADLARYDQIVGLITRHPESVKAAKPKAGTTAGVTDLHASRPS